MHGRELRSPGHGTVFEGCVLCTLHHLRYETGEDHDEASIALDLIAG